jgi:TrmH family RNA methyltransferase
VLVKSEVKYIQSLGQKKNRDADGVFVAEGTKIINELLVAPATQPIKLFATESWIKSIHANLKNFLEDKLTIVNESELEKISFLQTPHDVLGIFKKPVFKNGNLKKSITLLLDEIQDPGNMGTIIRTADWFNIKKIICSKESVEAFNPKVVQSTMGSIARVEVLYGNLQDLLNDAPDIPVYAATLNGQSIFESKKIDSGFILIGNESKGIKPELLKTSVHQITIPKLGNAESLNAAMAAGIIMAELCGKN